MISEELEKSLHKAFIAARDQRHELITVEHLLLAMIDNQSAAEVLKACSAKFEVLRKELTQFIDKKTPKVSGNGEVDTQPTIGFQRVIQRALLHVQSSGTQKVEGANILTAIFGEKESYAVSLLHQQDISRLDVINYISHGVKKTTNSQPLEEVFFEDIQAVTSSNSNKKNEKLRLFISYSHMDKDCLSRLMVHLKPIERKGSIECWSDKKLVPGEKWQPKIEKILEESTAAILLISADFLASDFIVNNELPPLLARAESQGIRIIPVILKPCGFHRDNQLSSFQAINDPKEPLLGLDHIMQEHLYDKIAEEVYKEIRQREKLI